MTASRTPRPCETCGVIFIPRRPGGKARRTGTRWGIYCGKVCQTAGQVKPQAAQAPKPLVTCRQCGGAFLQRSPRHVLCSDTCRRVEGRVAEYQRSAARKALVMRPCGECGLAFVPGYGVKRTLYCSPACGRRASRRADKQVRRARQRSGVSETVNATRVFERDGWRCHICAKKVRREKRGTSHPLAPELDHIIPLALGGHHTYANTACACRRCNGAKGATAFGQPSLLACAAA